MTDCCVTPGLILVRTVLIPFRPYLLLHAVGLLEKYPEGIGPQDPDRQWKKR